MLPSNVQSIDRPPNGVHDLTVLDSETIQWLLNACPVWPSSGLKFVVIGLLCVCLFSLQFNLA